MARTLVALLVCLCLGIGAVVAVFLWPSGGEKRTSSDASSIVAGTARPSASSAAGDSSIARLGGFDPDIEFQANELLLVNPPQNITDIARRLNYIIIERYSFQGLGFSAVRVRVPSTMTLQAARMQLATELPGVLVDYNHRYDASQAPRRPPDSGGSAVDQLKKGKVQSLAQAALGWKDVPPTCGKGLRLGMVDSGVEVGHPVLKGQDLEFRSFHGPEASPGDAEHGTAVAALLVGKPSDSGLGGLLPGATLKAANMFEKSPTGANAGHAMAMLRGLDWLVRERVSVINMSIAGANNAVVEKGISAVIQRGIVVVAAAGNWGRANKPAYPAAMEHVVAVTAIDSYEGIYDQANTGTYIDFAAPGVNVLTAAPGGGSKRQSGTSFAAPFLTATIALEIANGRAGTPATLEQTLSKVARDLGPSGKDPTYGAGVPQIKVQCPV